MNELNKVVSSRSGWVETYDYCNTYVMAAHYYDEAVYMLEMNKVDSSEVRADVPGAWVVVSSS